MKRIGLGILLLVSMLSCDLFSGDEDEDNRMDFDIEPNILINDLSDHLVETSGLIWFNDKMWSLNDGGGENEIYAIDSNGDIELTIEIENKTNADWEALAQDNNFIYIGDVGNNKGNRTNLKVFKVAKEDLDLTEDISSVAAEEIKFSYADQDDFSEREYTHEFDCASMLSFQDELYLFSKDWKNFKTTIYKLPKQSGDYKLEPSDSFDVNGLITGADLSSDGKYLALLGYTISVFNPENLKPFIYLFKFDSSNTFGAKTVFLNMNSIAGSQPEGVVFVDNNKLAFSTEKTNTFSQKVFEINWSEYKKYLD